MAMNKNHFRTIWLTLPLCFAAFWITGCEPVPHYNRLQVAAYVHEPAKPRGSEAVFQNPEDIKQPYEVIGMLSCEGSAGEEAGIVNAMLYHAADMGGDGILLGGPQVGSEIGQSQTNINIKMGWAALVGDGDRRAYCARVIRFKKQTK